MHSRYATFLASASWLSAVLAVAYHVRFLLFVEFASVQPKTTASLAFYFATGLGHESFAVFFVVAGIWTGGLLFASPSRTPARVPLVARLYLVMVLSLMASALLDYLGIYYANRSGLYADFPAFTTVTLDWHTFAANVLVLQPFLAPTFGSNAMLYLLSYLIWFSSAAALIAFAIQRYPRQRTLAFVLVAVAMMLVLPQKAMPWLFTWLLGIAVVAWGERLRARPSVWVSALLFTGALVLSRHVTSNGDVLPPPFGEWLLLWKYFIVAAGFSMVALALYPGSGWQAPGTQARVSRIMATDSACLFFFHFPVVMLLAGLMADTGFAPLMRAPGAEVYAVFALALVLSVICTIACGRAICSLAGVRRAPV